MAVEKYLIISTKIQIYLFHSNFIRVLLRTRKREKIFIINIFWVIFKIELIKVLQYQEERSFILYSRA